MTATRGQTSDARLDADAALTALYTAHYRRLVRLAALLLDDLSTSEEVVQDAYVKMHAAWRRIRDPQAAEAYLRTTVLNLSRSRMRRRQVAARHAAKPMPDAASAEYGAMVSFERQAVLAAVRTLPERQRECLILRYYGDLSEAQIAEAMGISAGAVKSHAFRGAAVAGGYDGAAGYTKPWMVVLGSGARPVRSGSYAVAAQTFSDADGYLSELTVRAYTQSR